MFEHPCSASRTHGGFTGPGVSLYHTQNNTGRLVSVRLACSAPALLPRSRANATGIEPGLPARAPYRPRRSPCPCAPCHRGAPVRLAASTHQQQRRQAAPLASSTPRNRSPTSVIGMASAAPHAGSSRDRSRSTMWIVTPQRMQSLRFRGDCAAGPGRRTEQAIAHVSRRRLKRIRSILRLYAASHARRATHCPGGG